MTDKQADRQIITDRHTDRLTDTQRQTDKKERGREGQIGKQTDKQAKIEQDATEHNGTGTAQNF